MGVFFNGRFRRGQALAAQAGIVERLNKVLDILENIEGADGIRIEKKPLGGITVGLDGGVPGGGGSGSPSGPYVTGIAAGSNDWELEISYSDGSAETVSVPHPSLVTSVEWDGSNGRIVVSNTSGLSGYINFVSYNY